MLVACVQAGYIDIHGHDDQDLHGHELHGHDLHEYDHQEHLDYHVRNY